MRLRRLLWAVLAVLLASPAVISVTAVPAAGARATPGRVFVTTAPKLPGVRLVVGSAVVRTGSDGRVALRVSDINGIASRVSLASRSLGDRHRLSLAYVAPAPHTVRYESHLTVGLDVRSKVRLRVDPGTTGAARGQVRAVRLHAITGETKRVDPRRGRSVWLVSRKARRGASSAPARITWTVDSLKAAPGSTFATSRARFDPFRTRTWQLRLRPVKGTVAIDTVPATAGVTFALDGATFTTDGAGHATSSVADLNGVDLRLRTNSPRAEGVTVSISRVARLAPQAAFQRHLLVALNVSRPVDLRFTDLAGRTVPADRVSEVRLDSAASTVLLGPDQLGGPVPLLSSIGKLVDGSWSSQPVNYAVTHVSVEGSNAVFAGQQRIDPSARPDWAISVSVFDVQVTVRDALFGHRLTSSAQVTRPDGGRSPVVLGAGRPTTIRSLVRGEYTLTTDSAVVGPDTRILVSRTSDVELRVITLLDAAVVTGLLLLGAGGLVAVGLARRRRSVQVGARRA